MWQIEHSFFIEHAHMRDNEDIEEVASASKKPTTSTKKRADTQEPSNSLGSSIKKRLEYMKFKKSKKSSKHAKETLTLAGIIQKWMCFF